MTSVPTRSSPYDFSTDPLASSNKVNAAQLQATIVDLYSFIDTLVLALTTSVRVDDTLVDALVRLRNLHSEVLVPIASASGWQLKAAVACASTGNLVLSGEQVIDGVLTSGSRVLVKDQTVASQNGIYVTAAGAWTRATDADLASKLGFACTYVTSGALNVRSSWVLIIATANIVLGTTSLTWVNYAGGAVAVSGTGNLIPDRYLAGVDFTAGSSTTVTLTGTPASYLSLLVYFDGVYQNHDTFTLSGAVVTFTSAIPFGTSAVEILRVGVLPIGTPGTGTVSNASLRNSVGSSLIGRSAATTGTPADIVIGVDQALVNVAGVLTAKKIANANIRDALGCSILGRSLGSAGSVDDIQIATDGHVIKRVAGALVSGLIGTANMDAVITPGTVANPTSLVIDAAGRVTAAVAGAATNFGNRVLLEDRKAKGVSGQALTTFTWVRRNINSRVIDTDLICALNASDGFQLVGGLYEISARAPAYQAAENKILLYNATTATVVMSGECAHCAASSGALAASSSVAMLMGRFTAVAGQVYEIWHYAGNGVSNGGGFATNAAATGLAAAGTTGEIYTHIELTKVG